jgi:hypothetical protein
MKPGRLPTVIPKVVRLMGADRKRGLPRVASWYARLYALDALAGEERLI